MAIEDPVGAVMVVGGGVGGIQAALDLADAGFKVHLVEEATAIGGRMAQLDKTFPTNDCAMCTLAPRLVEVGRHADIELHTGAELLEVNGDPGRLTARVHTRPRHVSLDKCTSCGDCSKVCPVALPNPYNAELDTRKAIHKLYAQAIPGAFAIEKKDPAPCRHGCPAQTNVHGYVSMTREGRVQEALDIIRQRIPLPGVLGRICHHPCEGECRRAEVDSSISIAAIKRFAADNAELNHPLRDDLDKIGRPDKRVAIVGSGPAGLTAADDLAAMGYRVTLFEAEEQLGGMLRMGIPRYRLPREVLDHEINHLVSRPGIEVQTGVRIGRDITLPGLRDQGYAAAFLAIGAEGSRRISVPGDDLDGVLWGIEFLKAVNFLEEVNLGPRVTVVGGGNVAMDVARCARRLGAEVDIVCLESREQMPASSWEITEALEEGCTLHPSRGPVKILGSDGEVRGIRLRRCLQVFDEAGRFAPEFDDDDTEDLDCDEVLLAIGQQSNLDVLTDTDLAPSSRGMLDADAETLQTAAGWIFAGGDAQGGAASAVEGLRDGHAAAISIDHYLRQEALPRDHKIIPTGTDWREIPNRIKKAPRYEPTLRSADERVADFAEAAVGLTPEQATADAARCLNCGLCCDCRACEKACKADAIIHDQMGADLELEIGAVILAPGFMQDDAEQYGEYGYGRWPNVVTSLEFERLLSATGPTAGHVQRPSDGEEPKRIAWIQCVGSRDQRHGQGHCSAVCCMFAAKEAMLARQHCPDTETTIFQMDLRAHGKQFDAFCDRAVQTSGLRYVRSQISRVDQVPGSQNVRVKYLDETSTLRTEDFDLIVLSTGIRPSPRAIALAERLDVALDQSGFAATSRFAPVKTSRPGIYVCGLFQGPKDISETVAQASAAATFASGPLAASRGLLLTDDPIPAETDVVGAKPRIAVFICRCGINIASVVDVPAVVDYASTLPGVVLATEAMFSCSRDHTEQMVSLIREHNINRVVVSSCTPRTHEPLFQSVLQEAGLNPYLFSMANIRDQCSWVHGAEPERATVKAKDLTRMAVSRARYLHPIASRSQPVTQHALVVGGGLAGLTAARELARQGFGVDLVERAHRLGGHLRELRYGLDGEEVGPRLEQLVTEVESAPEITVHLDSEVVSTGGFVGSFHSVIRTSAPGDSPDIELTHGVTLITTGSVPYRPTEHGYQDDDRVLTQVELEQTISDRPHLLDDANTVVMLQCVGSRNEEHSHCSRICCSSAIKNALRLKWLNPQTQIYVLYRDLRAYGLMERHYTRARKAGVIFLRFDPEAPPEVERTSAGLRVRITVPELARELDLSADRLVLSSGIVPEPGPVLRTFKVSCSPDGFLAEAHVKLRPVDLPADGLFLAGTVQGPKSIDETINQASAAAGRAARILWREEMPVSGVVSTVETDDCIACLTCVRACPFDVPVFDPELRAVHIEAAACRGCGICTAVCPAKAITLEHYKDDQLFAMLDAALAPRANAKS
jgi:heterodisulfide reductase subunit A2